MLNPSRGGGGKLWASLTPKRKEVARLPKGWTEMKVTRRCAAIATMCLLVFCASQGIGSENKSEHKPFSRITPVVAAVQKTQDSIVSVRVPRSGLKDMVGTGVIVDEGGLIITNRHVV